MRFRKDPLIVGVLLLSLLVLVESIQLVIITGLLSRFMPFHMDTFNLDLFPVNKDSLRPNHQIFVYHVFIASGILAQAAGLFLFWKKLKEKEFQGGMKRLLYADTFWVSLQCFAIFKLLVYQWADWAWGLVDVALGAAILSRIFWPEMDKVFRKSGVFLAHQPPGERWPRFSGEGLWMTVFILVESLQAVIAANWLLTFKSAPLPVLLYGIFLASALALFVGINFRKINLEQHKPFILAEAALTFFLLSALFKIVIYDYRSRLATDAYHILLGLALLNKICWKPLYPAIQRIRVKTAMAEAAFVVLIIGMLYMPDLQGVLAKMFAGEQFHHITSFIMAPAWAYVKGCVLDVDVISRYGIGFVVLLTTLTKLLGGFSYLTMLMVMMWICILYFILSYVFLRLWLKDVLLAMAAILMGIKLQMFYTLAVPQPLTYPSGTPVRFMFDLLFMFCIWRHLSWLRWIDLWLAALSCSLALFYMTETGLYLSAAFCVYLLILMVWPGLRRRLFPSFRDYLAAASCLLLVPVGALFFLSLTVGRHVFRYEFWYNMAEFAKYFTGGLELGPFYGGIQYGQFWDLLIGFLFPIVYLLTILIVGSLCFLGKLRRTHLLAVVLSFYGLGAHHYYVAMATANNYYMRALPFVFVVFYWIHVGLQQLPQRAQRPLKLSLLAVSAYALWTNHHYISYPNMLNFSPNPLVDPQIAEELPGRKPYLFHKVWDYPQNLKLPENSLGTTEEGLRRDFTTDAQLKEYYFKESDFSKDAALIRRLTAPEQPVALVSSFETEILMQADRKPLLYYFRLMYSRPMRMRSFPSDEILTTRQLQKLIGQIKGSEEPYVFMERIFLQDKVPPVYAYDRPGLMGLITYIRRHYKPVDYGRYLVAMKKDALG